MNKVSVIALLLGVASLAASGALYITREKHLPPVINVQPAPVTVQAAPAPVVNVQAPEPKPYVCTPQQADAGECLPIVTPTPKPRPALEVAHVTPKKKAKKKQSAAAKKLKSKWVAPKDEGFSIQEWLNGKR